MDQALATRKDVSDDVTCETVYEDISCVPCGPAHQTEETEEIIESTEEANGAFFCRFCLQATDNLDELISPCHCTGNFAPREV